MKLEVLDLGIIAYKEAFYKQAALRAGVSKQADAHMLIFCEHPHVYTVARNSRVLDSVLDYRAMQERGAELMCGVNRGGEITYHGPGQLMGYFIFDLRDFGRNLGYFIACLEEVLVRTLKNFGIDAQVRKGFRGAWVKDRKIASLGIGAEKWVTMHGFGLNVSTDMSFFDLIKPCGLDIRMTSMQEELGSSISAAEVKQEIKRHVADVFTHPESLFCSKEATWQK